MKVWKMVLIIALAAIFMGMIGCGQQKEEPAQEPEPEQEPVKMEMAVVDHTPAGEEIGTEATCPVCGMAVQVAESTLAVVYDNEIYYFCTAEDKAKFSADPQKYLESAEEEMEEESMEGESGQ